MSLHVSTHDFRHFALGCAAVVDILCRC